MKKAIESKPNSMQVILLFFLKRKESKVKSGRTQKKDWKPKKEPFLKHNSRKGVKLRSLSYFLGSQRSEHSLFKRTVISVSYGVLDNCSCIKPYEFHSFTF